MARNKCVKTGQTCFDTKAWWEMVERFVDGLKAAGVEFFAGVSDSPLKSFCAHVTDTCGESHVIAANEGGAVGWPAGH